MNDSYTQIISAKGESIEERVKSYLNKVYAWMAVSMFLTAGAAVFAMSDMDTLAWCFSYRWVFSIAAIVLIVIMAFGRNAISAGVIGAMFLAFSALEGLALAPLLSFYTTKSIGITFAATAGMFGGMSLFGLCTKKDLGWMGRFLMMALIGLLIAMLANMFWGTESTDMIISGIGVVIFAGFTAFDTQNLIRQGLVLEGEVRTKGAILGALDLYLDFINLFLFLLRFLGDRD